MEQPERKMGRPVGQDYPVIKQIRLGTDDAQKLTSLAEVWRCSEAAAIRRAIQETASRVDLEEQARQRQRNGFMDPAFVGGLPDPEKSLPESGVIGARRRKRAPKPEAHDEE